MTETQHGFPVVLRRVRQNARLSQRELAARVGVDHTYLSKIENGHLPPPAAETLKKIARECGASEAELLTEAGKPPVEVLTAALWKARQVLWEMRHASPHESDHQFILDAVQEIDEVLGG